MDKANYWYHKAAEKENKIALYKLGECYELGKGVCQNERQAFEFIKDQLNKDLLMLITNLGIFTVMDMKLIKKKHLIYINLLRKEEILMHSWLLHLYTHDAKVLKKI
ncbi:hypothetical protein GLOIN_2v1586734 [Rhizophagus irregularis DAOM 181602=DAOM 197198]|uniref:Uncharacterized protein n=1 Tax=Rhizophagus irregularis (strain DAOM 181602 / DAOM 197198 / MUCL 43194) TaxID=747089 RepID=A0A2P4Q764_RHIID|nr:hypothetical protein GLOIN_2v1586734 [Rhizophagus irregularis DAOM 181602=DAOM 197198]POG73469.1 hypothetical protein GLOIN_2v1586734 [Rhizophagus irregularis DAOM 181602=DAOM 197198]|eukprot:XP_025180335.1 hypothetical protein GLOIN_2v1586734 [Rhizophagus irregularis DAOM 181602=DAOM 197198]